MACNDYFLKTFTNLEKHYNKLGKEIENTRMMRYRISKAVS